MSTPRDREIRLDSLRMKLGRELEEDLRKAGSDLKDRLNHDFEREMLLAERIPKKPYTIGQLQICFIEP
jgi:hypothetical protein